MLGTRVCFCLDPERCCDRLQVWAQVLEWQLMAVEAKRNGSGVFVAAIRDSSSKSAERDISVGETALSARIEYYKDFLTHAATKTGLLGRGEGRMGSKAF